MTPRAYYNEFDPKAAAWLRALIAAGEIMPGDVDERSIADVRPDDLAGYTRCHFFAGIGGWEVALRLAEWPAERPVWTGSCPCQPFSVAGQGKGQSDERHLWPEWHRLIRECRPDTIFGEQVEAAIRHGWLDLVQADLESEGYAVGATVLPAAGFGAPHGRHRLWFVADAQRGGQRGGDIAGSGTSRIEVRQRDDGARSANESGDDGADARGMADAQRWTAERHGLALGGEASGEQGEAQERQRIRNDAGDGEQPCAVKLADSNHARREEDGLQPLRRDGHPVGTVAGTDGLRAVGRMADSDRAGCEQQRRSGVLDGERAARGHDADGCGEAGALGDTSGPGLQGRQLDGARHDEWDRTDAYGPVGEPSRAPGFWDACDWIACRDGKWRPVESSPLGLADGLFAELGLVRYGDSQTLTTFPLIQKGKERTRRLRGYGNAIVPQVAAEVIAAFMEVAA